MPQYQKFLFFAQRVYHRLPLQQQVKWRIRKVILPILLSLRQENPSITQALKAAFVQPPSLRDSARELRLQNLLLTLDRRGVRKVSHIIAVPFMGTGGAENVALNYARAVRELYPEQEVLLVVADRSHVDERVVRVDGVHVVVLSDFTNCDSYEHKQSTLYDLIVAIRPAVFHNINSEVGWNVIIESGERLRRIAKLFACIFAFQFSEDGKSKTGYAAYFLRPGLPALTALLSDNQRFVTDARLEYELGDQGGKLHAIYNPSRVAVSNWRAEALDRIAQRGIALSGKRPAFLWAGRLDKEKRIDLLVALAKICPHFDFYVYGQSVVDSGELLPDLPNLHVQGPFASPAELMTDRQYTGFIFTSKWEGMPNILLEIGALGVPIVAPAVGGVAELITDATGYLLPESPTADDYRAAMEAMIADPAGTDARARALVELIDARHTWPRFVEYVRELEGYGV
ncbi:glycosyltransferase family 4 protein [Burkholderia multivorans]|uniref:glycosyltransferase family 4 protein n=1 Tax=Burkholderia multivorans TaxID=87883 RepID=UPI000841A46E|nr:glycosyltransferase family 4 protein [Burkholderia multivorans]AOJ92177.1 glycosyl transferase family 1 [Burkholderia multivorans]MDN7942175.1 glycosyltransferase family 4 protein [Burkholderia multivorans]MDN7969405.1 glycosyltransferase family 4 protein [Burkholderia multivorans]